MGRTARGLLLGCPMGRRRERFRPMDASAELTSTAYSPTIANALRGSSALAWVRQRSPTTRWLMKPWIGSRHILQRTSTSIACSVCRDERGGQHGDKSDQDRVGTTVKSERCSNVVGFCRIPSVSHESIVDMDAGITTRTCERQTERSCHCRFRVARVRRAVVTGIAAYRAPGGRCRSPFRCGGRRDDEQSREPRCRQVEQVIEACSRPTEGLETCGTMPDHAVRRVDGLINSRAWEPSDDHPEDRRNHPVGKILRQAFDCRARDTCFVEHLGFTTYDVRYRFAPAGETGIVERVGNTRYVLVQAALGDQCAGNNPNADQAERQNQESALDDEGCRADNANEQQNGDSSEYSSQRRGPGFAIPSTFQCRDQAAHPDHGMAN